MTANSQLNESANPEIIEALRARGFGSPTPSQDSEPSASESIAASLGRLLLDLYQLAATSRIGEFEEQVFTLLREHFSFDSAWMGRSTMILSGPVMHNNQTYNLPDGYVKDWEQIKSFDPLVPMVMDSPGKTALVRMPEMRAPFLEFAGKYGLAQVMCATAVDQVLKLWTHLSLYRNGLLPPFSDRDMQLMDHAMPHIASAINLNRVHHIEQLKAAKVAPRVSIAICDNLGVLQYADSAFADLMLMEWPEWNGAMLPRVVRDYYEEKQAKFFPGTHITLQAERVSDLMLISARPRSAIDILTPKELAVARLYGEGLTYKTVARRMGLSPATVRHHLRQAYLKLRIQNKGEIAWLVSRDDHLAI